MKKKILLILLLILFIVGLIFINKYLSNRTISKTDDVTNIKKSETTNSVSSISKVIEVTEDDFDEVVLNSETPVLIDFYADWCPPCKKLSPIVEEVASENSNVKFVKINVDYSESLAIKYNISSIPTLVLIKEGKEVDRSIGLISKTQIESLID